VIACKKNSDPGVSSPSVILVSSPSVILANAGIQRNAAQLGSRIRENDGKETSTKKESRTKKETRTTKRSENDGKKVRSPSVILVSSPSVILADAGIQCNAALPGSRMCENNGKRKAKSKGSRDQMSF
jgi:hypothetical protein